MKNEIIYGEAVALNWEAPADGSTTVKVQLSPFGEFTLHDGGKRNGTVQHCSKSPIGWIIWFMVTITEFNSGHDTKRLEAIKNLPRAKKAGEN